MDMIVKATVFPDLYDKELQDSYGVMTPNDLVYAMVDDAGEMQDFQLWMQKFQGFTKTLDEKVEEAKLIEEGDGEANYAYYALLKLHILPSVFLEMDEQEKAFVIASIKLKAEHDKKEKKKAEARAKKNTKKGR